uniref:Uncharacterized protein n=1 Tax=Anopheles atroparvus TaxID=41427 RepID=A0A182IZL0_ANOAO
MGAFSRSLAVLCVFFISYPWTGNATDNILDPSWLKPGALDRWQQRQRSLKQPDGSCEAQRQPTVECNCPPQAVKFNDDITEDQKLAPTVYRKLVKTLFERDALQLDPSGAFYNSVLSLKVSSRQLDKLLDEVVSIREIDTTLAEILEHITVLNKWKACNENLREQSLRSHRWSPTESTTLPICDPMEVLLEATVSMQAVYFNAMFKQFLNAFREHTKEMGYFQSLLIGLLLLGFAYVLLTTMLQVGIASGFRTFGTVVTAGLQFPRHAALAQNGDGVNAPPPTVNLNIQIGDAIAGAPPRTGLYRLESQRVEIVPEEQPIPAIAEKAVPMIEDKRKATEVKGTERQKEDPKSSTTLTDEEESDIEIIDG